MSSTNLPYILTTYHRSLPQSHLILPFGTLLIQHNEEAHPPSLNSPSLKLTSRVLTPPNSSFNNLYLSSYHIYPAFDYAVFVTNNTQGSGIVGYLNGTAAEFVEHETDLVYDIGNGNPPYGFVIQQVYSSYNPVEIKGGKWDEGGFC